MKIKSCSRGKEKARKQLLRSLKMEDMRVIGLSLVLSKLSGG